MLNRKADAYAYTRIRFGVKFEHSFTYMCNVKRFLYNYKKPFARLHEGLGILLERNSKFQNLSVQL